MATILIEANLYQTRKDLEDVVRSTVGPDIVENSKSDYRISGTRAVLQRLGLDDTTPVFGVLCVITDTPTQDRVELGDPSDIVPVPEREVIVGE